jgi:hypothetical protein
VTQHDKKRKLPDRYEEGDNVLDITCFEVIVLLEKQQVTLGVSIAVLKCPIFQSFRHVLGKVEGISVRC